MVWSPLAGGLLSGKFGADDKGPEGARRASFDFPVVDKARAFRVVDAMRPIVRRHQVSVARVVLVWLLSRPQVGTVIVGAKTPAQLEDTAQPGLAARAVLSRCQSQPSAELPRTLEVVSIADRRHDRRGRRRSDAWELHQLPCPFVLTGELANVLVVLGNAIIQLAEMTEQVANDRVAPAGQILEHQMGLLAHGIGLEKHDNAQLAQQAPDAVDQGCAFLDIALACPMHELRCLLLDAFDGHKAHVRSRDRLADCREATGAPGARLSSGSPPCVRNE